MMRYQMRKSHLLNWLVFLFIAFVAIALHRLFFGMTYIWYLQPDNANFIARIYYPFLALKLFVLAFFPSRILISVVGFIGFILPAVLRPDVFKLGAAPLVVLCFLLALLSVAAYLRQHVNDDADKNVSGSS